MPIRNEIAVFGMIDFRFRGEKHLLFSQPNSGLASRCCGYGHDRGQALRHRLRHLGGNADSFESVSFGYRYGRVDANLGGEHAIFFGRIDASGSQV